MSNFEKSPINFAEEKRKNILKQFGETDNMEKALSKDDFNAKYGVGHDVFTQSDIEKFEADAKTKHGTGEDIVKAIESEFSTLTSVLVKGTGEGIEKVFVRESAQEPEPVEENKEEVKEGK